MEDQPEDAPAVENPPPPVNPPIQPIQPVNSLPLPSKFEGANNPNQADMWPKWLRHFERYRIASGLQNKSNQEQVRTFLYAMGDCADDIVKTLSINEATSLCLLRVSSLRRLIIHGGSGLDPSNAIKQNGRPTRRCSCSWKSASTR